VQRVAWQSWTPDADVDQLARAVLVGRCAKVVVPSALDPGTVARTSLRRDARAARVPKRDPLTLVSEAWPRRHAAHPKHCRDAPGLIPYAAHDVTAELSLFVVHNYATHDDGPDAPMGVGGERLLAWYGAGDTDYRLPGTDMAFKVSPQTAEFLRQTRETTGALVFGRRTFDLTHGWGGNHPLDVPVFVVSSSVPQEWVHEGSPFTFVTDGLESALEQAQAVAGLDEIHIDLVPVLLGGGVRLFDHLDTGPIDLERTRVIEGALVTHLTFRVVR
jgi:hypothetical protein